MCFKPLGLGCNTFLCFFQIVHRTLAAMLGSLAALAVLAVIGDVSGNILSECLATQKNVRFKDHPGIRHLLVIFILFYIISTFPPGTMLEA